MTRWLATSSFAPWTGVFAGAFAWFAHHQLGSDGNQWDCARAGGPWVIGVGLACALLAAGGGWVSWLARTPQGDPAAPTRAFGRIVGMLAAATFLLTIGFQVLAGVIVPGCFR
jgi:hypothetical protein